MADRSSIEWTEATWNPIVGCSLVSPGCTNCYAMKMAGRLGAMKTSAHYAGTTHPSKAGAVWTGKVAPAPDRILTQPLRWSRPRTIFVNSMGDLFHEDVPDAWIDRVFAVMALCPQHTFQVLTKRSKRMRAYIESRSKPDERGQPAEDIRVQLTAWLATPSWRARHPTQAKFSPLGKFCASIAWPLPNVWLGVSAEDQKRADERIPDLLATPAARRFVSCEPLLGPIGLKRIPVAGGWYDALEGWRDVKEQFPGIEETLDLVIVGGESGPGARPMHPDWARSLRDQCAVAGVPFFFKQWGEWLDERLATAQGCAPGPDMFDRYGSPKGPKWHPYDAADRNGGALIRIGKARAGRLLDGVEHNGMPERSAHG